MARRIMKSQQAHLNLIRALLRQYESQGYLVKADHIAHLNGRPPEIGGHIPDLAAYNNGTIELIAEAETCDTIVGGDTREQWMAFAASRYAFEVIVPQSCLVKAQRQASAWDVLVNKWWSIQR